MSRPVKEQILNLARRMRTVADRWEPVGQEEYEEAVNEFVKSAEKEEIIELAVAIENICKQGKAMWDNSLYPILMAFTRRFGGTPELYVEIYGSLHLAGGKGSATAPEYLRKAYEMDPMNYYVLWEMFTSYPFIRSIHGPTFPPDLMLSSDNVKHEKECIRRILEVAPGDKLAHRIRKWMEKHGKSYVLTVKAPIPIMKIGSETRPLSRMSLRELLEKADP